MPTLLRNVLLANLAFVLSACGNSSPGTGISGPCESNDDCASEHCVERMCSNSPTPISDVGDVPPIQDVGSDSASESDSAGGPRGAFGEPCDRNGECLSGYCISASRGDDRFCTSLCDGETCDREGFECALIENFGGDRVFLCVPEENQLCESCDEDLDCGGLGNLCVTQNSGTFCATQCGEDDRCRVGFECVTETRGDDEFPVCVPESGFCEECVDNDGDRHGNGPACVGGDCDDSRADIFEGAPELCDTVDNDCDGDADEGFDLSTDPVNCGACGVICSPDNAAGSCAEGVCGVDECEDGWNDCNADPSDGCERADADLNECGGCATLEADPGDACGPCGLDVWACDGSEALACSGETPSNLCGGCLDLEFAPGDPCGPCSRDSYACNGAEGVECDGATAVNECGGCAALDGAVGDACGSCGLDALACDGAEALVCDGATASNECGGCSELEFVVGSACGPCLDGTWRCDGSNDVACDGAAEATSCPHLGTMRFGWGGGSASDGTNTIRLSPIPGHTGRGNDGETDSRPFPEE